MAGLPLAHVLNLVIGLEPERLVFDYAPKLIAEPDQVIDGQTFQALRLDQVDNFDWLFLIDPKSHLLSYVDLVVDPEARKTLAVESIRWASGAIATEPIKDEAFTFQPPAGFTKVASLSEAVARQAEAPKQAPGEKPSLVGKPAPDFMLDALDGPESFRKVTKASLAGKVVLIDFWATWCGPCLEEMPGIQKLIEAYSKDKKDVVVVALSIDQAEAGDLKEAEAWSRPRSRSGSSR